MCSGHSPPALIHDRMLHRSLHRSMQEAAALCNSRAHPPSISTGLAKYYVKIWDFGGWGPGLKITNGPFGLIAPHIPQLCWGYAYASSWDALCCEQDDAVLGSASRNGSMHLEPAAHPALAGCGTARGRYCHRRCCAHLIGIAPPRARPRRAQERPPEPHIPALGSRGRGGIGVTAMAMATTAGRVLSKGKHNKLRFAPILLQTRPCHRPNVP